MAAVHLLHSLCSYEPNLTCDVLMSKVRESKKEATFELFLDFAQLKAMSKMGDRWKGGRTGGQQCVMRPSSECAAQKMFVRCFLSVDFDRC